MKKSSFYLKFAITNIKNNSKTYLPYILTCIGTVLMFYNMIALALNETTGDGTLAAMLCYATVTVGIFSAVLIFYTNSFLIKRRKKELGLYNVLGMEKKHIAKIMFWENTVVGTVSIIFGQFFGIVFSKLVTLLLYKLLNFDPGYGFNIDIVALVNTILLFTGIFILTLVSSLVQVYRARPVELLQSSSVGEREPRSNWLLTIIGVATLGLGYYISLTTDNPLAAIPLFFVAVILVIIGTYCLFTAGSVVLLKILKRNKKYYYKTNNFVSVSSMMYRMKKNAVGLANICIISTAVLVMISTTVSMYVGLEDLMNYRYPQDAHLWTRYEPTMRDEIGNLQDRVKSILDKDNMSYTGFAGYEYLTIDTKREGNRYTSNKGYNDFELDTSVLIFISADDYGNIINEKIELNKDEVILISDRYEEEISILDKRFSVKDIWPEVAIKEFSTYLNDLLYVIVSDSDVIDELYNMQKEAYGKYARDIYYDMYFDFEAGNEEIIAYCKDTFIPEIKGGEHYLISSIKQLNVEEFYILYGGLFFLGIFLGLLFIIATVLIIYYKQVVEGYEDKERFRIMQNIGMSKLEVKKSINSQVLTVFALPILAAIVHIIFAFPILTKLLALLNLTNVTLFIVCTIATIVIFAMFYVAVYFATSKVYFKIVN